MHFEQKYQPRNILIAATSKILLLGVNFNAMYFGQNLCDNNVIA